jgi:chromosomal replication initiator protein
MPQIAVYFGMFGMKDHTTVSHAIKKILELAKVDKNFKELIDRLSTKINSLKSKFD